MSYHSWNLWFLYLRWHHGMIPAGIASCASLRWERSDGGVVLYVQLVAHGGCWWTSPNSTATWICSTSSCWEVWPRNRPRPANGLKRIGNFVKMITEIFKNNYLPEKEICVYESLVLFKGRLPFQTIYLHKTSQIRNKIIQSMFQWWVPMEFQCIHWAGFRCLDCSTGCNFIRKDNIIAVKFYDKKEVCVISSEHTAGFAERTRVMPGNQQIVVQTPSVIRQYSQFMQGVDRRDQMMHNYDCTRKSYCWFKKLGLPHFIQRAILNAHNVYCEVTDSRMSLLRYHFNTIQYFSEGKTDFILSLNPSVTGDQGVTGKTRQKKKKKSTASSTQNGNIRTDRYESLSTA